MKLYYAPILLCALSLTASPLPLDDENDDQGKGPKLAYSELIRTADLTPDTASIIPLPWGTDSLDSGFIEVRSRRVLDLRLNGAPKNVTYSVLICGLTTAANRCTTLGQITTDSNGKADETLDLPASLKTAAAFFAITRGGSTHFASGFTLSALPPTSDSAEVHVRGKVVSKNEPANIFNIQGFTPVIYIDSETKLKGFDKISELAVGTDVQVQGVTRADGNVQARMVMIMKGHD